MQAAEHSFGLNGVRCEATWARARSRLGMAEGIGMADDARPEQNGHHARLYGNTQR